MLTYPNPTEEAFKGFLEHPQNSYILIAHRKECLNVCAAEKQVIAEQFERFKMMDPHLEIFTMNVAKLYDAQNVMVLDTDHGVYYIHRGEVIRVDTNDLQPEQMRHLLTDLTAVVQRRVPVIDNLEDIRDLNHTNKLLHFYYGQTDQSEFKEYEIAAKLTDRDLFRIENPAIADLFKIADPGVFTYDKTINDAYRMKGDIKRSKILKFLLASSRPVPQEFDQDKVSTSIHFNMPVLFVWARTPSTNQSLLNVLRTTEQYTKSFFHVYHLTDRADPHQTAYFNECDQGQNWGFIICILRAKRGHIFRFIYDKKVITYERVVDFLDSFASKKLQPYFRSQDIKEPVTNTVRNLNFHTFQEVMDLTSPTSLTNVVILYYSSTSGSGSSSVPDSFQSAFEAVSAAHSSASLVFCRIDLAHNEVYEVQHLPLPTVHYTSGYDDPHVLVYKAGWNRAEFESWLKDAVVQWRQSWLKAGGLDGSGDSAGDREVFEQDL
jgi:hypothetical protein